jgi:hypothetical protein
MRAAASCKAAGRCDLLELPDDATALLQQMAQLKQIPACQDGKCNPDSPANLFKTDIDIPTTMDGKWSGGDVHGTKVSFVDEKGQEQSYEVVRKSDTAASYDAGEGHMIRIEIEKDGKLHFKCDPGEKEIECDKLEVWTKIPEKKKETLDGKYDHGEIHGTKVSFVDENGDEQSYQIKRLSDTKGSYDAGEGHMINVAVEEDGKAHFTCDPGEKEIECDKLEVWTRKSEKAKPKGPAASLDGRWSGGEVHGTKVSFVNEDGEKQSYEMIRVSKSKAKYDAGEGHMIRAEVEDDGKLHFKCDEGESEIECDKLEIWTRMPEKKKKKLSKKAMKKAMKKKAMKKEKKKVDLVMKIVPEAAKILPDFSADAEMLSHVRFPGAHVPQEDEYSKQHGLKDVYVYPRSRPHLAR